MKFVYQLSLTKGLFIHIKSILPLAKVNDNYKTNVCNS